MNIPQQKLCTLIARYGEALCNDPHRCEALLRDLCAPEAYPKEISLIRQAQEQGLVQDLLNVKHYGADYKTVEAKWLRTLKADYAIAEEAARWTIEAWGQALGVSSKASPQPTKSQTGLIVSVIVVLLAVSGIWLSEQYRIGMERQKEVAREGERKATIAAAYNGLLCKERPIDSRLESRLPDYVDPKSGAKYYGPLPPLPPFIYEAITVFANGDRYDGEFLSNQKNGCGTYSFSDGRIYIGQFKNDRFNGKGRLILRDRNEYVGEFEDGKCQGKGIIIYSSGDIYQDTWKANRSQNNNQQCGL